jgi:Trichohyalin-plectin-homology domain
MRVESEKMKKRSDDERARGREILEYNKQFKILAAEEARVQRLQDQLLIDYAIQKEKEQDAAEEAKRIADRESGLQYRKYLEEQMVKEAEDTAFVDEVRRREEERVWKARDDALRAREEARKRLMKMVDEGRQEQMKAKHEAILHEKAEGQVFAAKFIEDAKEGIQREREEAERRRQIQMDNQEKLKQQMAIRENKEDLVRQEIYLENKHMEYMERKHRQKLSEQGGAVKTYFPLKQSQWYS